MSTVADPAVAAVVEFVVKTRPTKEQLFDYLVELDCKYPEARSKLGILGVFLANPKFSERVAQFLDLLNHRIEAAGFADHPEDYLLRPVLELEGALPLRDLKDTTANINLGDVILLNNALDRHQARQQRQREKDALSARSTRTEEARKLAKLMLETGEAKTLAPTARIIAPVVGMKVGSTANAIRYLFRK